MATYKALSNGYLGKTAVKVTRGRKEINAAFILKDDIFEWDGPKGEWMEPVVEDVVVGPEEDTPAAPATMYEMQQQNIPDLPEEITGEKTKNQIVDELRRRGIHFNIADKKEVLAALLEGN